MPLGGYDSGAARRNSPSVPAPDGASSRSRDRPQPISPFAWGRPRCSDDPAFLLVASSPRAQLAQRALAAVGQGKQRRLPCELVYPRRLNQSDAERHIPRRPSARVLNVEVPAHHLQARRALADLEQQFVETQQWAVAADSSVLGFPWCSHAATSVTPIGPSGRVGRSQPRTLRPFEDPTCTPGRGGAA
jgi:hypothetical protein